MGTTCLTVCPDCNRHLRCGERACPFCGARVLSGLRVLEYRIKTRLSRSQAFSLGASLTLAGFVTSCDEGQSVSVYGAPCNPPSCIFPGTGGSAGSTAQGGKPSAAGSSGTATGGTMTGGTASGGTPSGGTAGAGGTATAGAGGDAAGGGGGELAGAGAGGDLAGGAGGDPAAGASGQGGGS
jgi:hypothetical protein